MKYRERTLPVLVVGFLLLGSSCRRIEAFQNGASSSGLNHHPRYASVHNSPQRFLKHKPTFLPVSLSSDYEPPKDAKTTSGDDGVVGVGGNEEDSAANNNNVLSPLEASITKFAMMTYIASMCVALPISLLPLSLLRQTNLVSKTQSEHLALQTGEFCARFLLRLMPFVHLTVIPSHPQAPETNPQPSIWVANHVSQIDTFLLLAADAELRGPHKRPIKTIYVSY